MRRLGIVAVGLALVVGIVVGGIVGNPFDGAGVGAATLTPPFFGRLVLPYQPYPGVAYANANDHPELDVTGSLTVEAWVNYLGDYSSLQNIAYKINAYDLYLAYDPGARCVGFTLWSVSGPVGGMHCHRPPPYYGGWHHVAGVFSADAGEMRTYLDGSLYYGPSPFTTTINNSSDILQVGYRLVGEIDELRISDTARYTGSTYSVPTSPFTCDDHTHALWHFDELDGATEFHDSCGAVDNLLVGYNGAHTEGGGPPPTPTATATLTATATPTSTATPVSTPTATPTPAGVHCGGLVATIVGTAGNDVINGTAGNDVIAGLGGSDSIDGLAGNDVICGGTGDDTLNGSGGGDRLLGQGGTDVLNGGLGNDTLTGGPGSDTMDGGAGKDTATFAAAVTANLTTGTATGEGTDTLVVGTIENVTGSNFNDNLTGNAAANTLNGGAGNDILNGMAGNDTLNGGNGDDAMDGGPNGVVPPGDACKGGAQVVADTAVNCETVSGVP